MRSSLGLKPGVQTDLGLKSLFPALRPRTNDFLSLASVSFPAKWALGLVSCDYILKCKAGSMLSGVGLHTSKPSSHTSVPRMLSSGVPL